MADNTDTRIVSLAKLSSAQLLIHIATIVEHKLLWFVIRWAREMSQWYVSAGSYQMSVGEEHCRAFEASSPKHYFYSNHDTKVGKFRINKWRNSRNSPWALERTRQPVVPLPS